MTTSTARLSLSGPDSPAQLGEPEEDEIEEPERHPTILAGGFFGGSAAQRVRRGFSARTAKSSDWGYVWDLAVR